MATTISVNKQSVAELLATGRVKPFVIPEYQRPYAWTIDQIETLFEDLWDFATNVGGSRRSASYFLGSIVSFENDKQEQEIIDGQQRITSLLLLLRAIYTKLSTGDDASSDEAQYFIRKIEPTIWRTDNLTGKVDYSNILLSSQVVNNEGNEILRKILETGYADSKAEDNYSRNYILFQELYDRHCSHSPFAIYDFIYALLNQAILLPIAADSQDTALTIFSTLNDRGLPLSDADIFKAKIYNNLPAKEDKDTFISQWKKLEEDATEANESIQQLFYYYMFYLRAKEGDVSSTTPGVRKYYLADKAKRLFEPELMKNLGIVLNLWKVININYNIITETWDNDKKVRKALDILTSYPNEFWKYPVVIYYLTHRGKTDFDKEFLLFLNKLIEELLSRFILYPTINFVKADIMKLNAKIATDSHPDMGFRTFDKSTLKEKIILPHRNIIRMLLKTFAYNHQDDLLPDKWQIEHILPQNWQKTFFPAEDDSEVEIMVEHIGNKTPFERKLNIVAGDGYFTKKQKEYSKSTIEVTKLLATSTSTDWSLDHIKRRDEIVAKEIMDMLSNWDINYKAYTKDGEIVITPTPEEQAMIEMLRKKGLIK